MAQLPSCGPPSSCGALCGRTEYDEVGFHKPVSSLCGGYSLKDNMVPTVNWLKVVVPTQCEECKVCHDYVLYVSRDGRACGAIAKGLAYEQWF